MFRFSARSILKKRRSEAGISLLELMIAGFVLVVGMMGSLMMITLAIAGNSRNKLDTTGTMVAQLVIEQINALPTNIPNTTIPVRDCAATPTTFSISVTDPTTDPVTLQGTGSGANLTADGLDIDFSQALGAVPAGYGMLYQTCGGTDATRITYDVRWHIRQISGLTRMVIVSARRLGGAGTGAGSAVFFQRPITLRTISGP